eukprot:3523705-Pyramimonas_sp.AAC.1
MDMWGATFTVVSGGHWPQDRKLDVGHDVSPLCPRCQERRETLRHRVWSGMPRMPSSLQPWRVRTPTPLSGTGA